MKIIEKAKFSYPTWENKETEGDWLNRMNEINFLIANGMEPNHHLLDIGTGWLRCGIDCIKYLDKDRFFGYDYSLADIELGFTGIAKYGLEGKNPTLAVEKYFDAQKFSQEFDFAFANSIFTHLHPKAIMLCISNTVSVLKENGKFFATIYKEDSLTGFDDNPDGFFLRSTQPYSFYEEICKGLCKFTSIGKWIGSDAAYGQQMLLFERLK